MIGPDELLAVRFPDLKRKSCDHSKNYEIDFQYSLSSADANSTLAKNLGKNIIRKLVVKLEGNEIISTDDCDILYSYYDCWKTKNKKR